MIYSPDGINIYIDGELITVNTFIDYVVQIY